MDPVQEMDAHITALQKRIAELEKALRPFAIACYNDNGDVTISTGHIHVGDYMRAKRVMRSS